MTLPFTYADSLDRAPVTNPRLEDFAGNAISQNVNVKQLIQITADVTNKQDEEQKFVYILQIKDSQGVIIFVNWIGNISLQPQQTFSPALSWSPDRDGQYIAEIFIWESFSEPDALSESVTLNISAS